MPPRTISHEPASERAPSPPPTFVALDFETADYGRDSACALALVRVEAGVIVQRAFHYIRPPRQRMIFTYLHGISWEQVAGAPAFAQLWPQLQPLLAGAAFLAAHNASFDRSVMQACCAAAGLPQPAQAFACTVRLARAAWQLRPARLPDVCRHLGIPLQHHAAASDAEACARIVLAAAAAGQRLPQP